MCVCVSVFPSGIEQDLNSCATTERGVRGIALSREGGEEEDGENAGGRRPGFRPAGGALERMWLAHSLSSSRYRVEGRRVRREGGRASGCGGLKINPVEVSSFRFHHQWSLIAVTLCKMKPFQHILLCRGILKVFRSTELQQLSLSVSLWIRTTKGFLNSYPTLLCRACCEIDNIWLKWWPKVFVLLASKWGGGKANQKF